MQGCIIVLLTKKLATIAIFIECKPILISMRMLLCFCLQSEVNCFINEKIVFAYILEDHDAVALVQ